ncbi:hypothetical protein PRZ48_015051 [Zasmidium cellare]|uniref:PB1 domain-containing protein n=1 Tax=Zasmidium cellare TaxID=395010 RepID=A0ABR0DXX5_ZASCE|nr:hypothetical protein PRZ48_015051 [Zasmidium cellare]
MGRSGPGVLDLLSSIGLRAPYTKTAGDWKASEDAPVKEFYTVKLPNLCELHHTKSNDEILHGISTRNAAIALFEEYGPQIWSRAKNRPWLFNPGEVKKHAPYKRKLYYDVPEDNAFLKEKVLELVIERIFRHHKENISKTRASSVDGSWRSTPVPAIRSTRTSLTASTTNVACFSTAFGLAAHQDATALQEQGIWLGDYSEEKEAVNGPSYDDVQRDYFFQTDAGQRKAYDEPYVFDEATETTEDLLLCAGCQSGALLKIECHEFEWEDEDSETTMTKNVWTYPCKLGDRKVFALIKQMPNIQSDTTVWGFWRVDGGYTTNLLLASRPAVRDRARSDLGQSSPKRGSEGGIQPERAKKPKRVHDLSTFGSVIDIPRITDDSASTSSGPSVVPRDWAPVNSANSSGQVRPHAAGSSKAFGKLPLRDSIAAAGQGNTLRPSPINATTGSIYDNENLYESTPRPDQRSTQPGFFRAYTQLRNEDAVIPTLHQPHDSPAEDSEEAQQQQVEHRSTNSLPSRGNQTPRQDFTPFQDSEPPFVRFRYFVTASWTTGQNIVLLDDTMDVRTVYARVQRTLSRKLEGKEVASLSFTIQDEAAIDVEIDDVDAWETVLEMIKEAGLTSVKGAVLRSD